MPMDTPEQHPAPPPAPLLVAPAAPPPAVAASGPIVIARRSEGPNLLVRAIWFVFVGWWLTGLVNIAAYLIALTVLGLPVAFMIFNRLPSVLTLRPRTVQTTHEVADGVTYVTESTVPQRAFWRRSVYFLLVGWWFGAFWSALAWVMCVLILTIPLGVMMYNRLPAVMTLRRY
jgi:uncharacterized membrane protein YccF (DUF307 family)